MRFVPALTFASFAAVAFYATQALAAPYGFSSLNTATAFDVDDAGAVLMRKANTAGTYYRIESGRWSQVALSGKAPVIDGVSDSGAITGYLTGDWREHPKATSIYTMAKGGLLRTIAGSPGASTAVGTKINNKGTVAGAADYPSRTSPGTLASSVVIWQGGKAQPLAFLGGSSASATALNNNDELLAQVIDRPKANDASTWRIRSVLWDKGTITKLPTLGGVNSYGLDINDKGQVAGEADLPNGTSPGVIWTDNKARNVGTLSGTRYCELASINNSGMAVGSSFNGIAYAGGKAALWDGSKLVDLNSLIGSYTGVYLSRALDINNSGQILALGTLNGVTMNFLLNAQKSGSAVVAGMMSVSAVPEPACAGVLVTVGVYGFSRRHRSI